MDPVQMQGWKRGLSVVPSHRQTRQMSVQRSEGEGSSVRRRPTPEEPTFLAGVVHVTPQTGPREPGFRQLECLLLQRRLPPWHEGIVPSRTGDRLGGKGRQVTGDQGRDQSVGEDAAAADRLLSKMQDAHAPSLLV